MLLFDLTVRLQEEDSAAIDIIILVINPSVGGKALEITRNNALEMLSILPPVFILLGLLDAWVDRKVMIRLMEESSGFHHEKQNLGRTGIFHCRWCTGSFIGGVPSWDFIRHRTQSVPYIATKWRMGYNIIK